MNDFPYPTEAELVAALRRGEANAYEQLIEQYADGVYRTAYRLLQNPHDAEDAMQEAFLTVYLHIADFQGQSRLSTWLYRIVTNKALDLLRKRQRKTDAATDAWEDLSEDAEELLPDTQAMLPEDWLARREINDLITAWLESLSPSLRAAFVLFEMEDLNMEEVAEALEISVAAAKARVHRARRALQEFLSAHLSA
jgi:RNA polymerase sigma-70 factor (ECF subfamily)